MKLDINNYYSIEANKQYISVSQYKNFQKCSKKAMFNLEQENEEDKICFLEGKLFETLIAGDIDLFMMQHPELVSSRGATKGELKANFKKVVLAANKIKQQKFIMDIIKKCKKQVIMTGNINGIEVKCCADLLDEETGNIYDLKCMANFNETWNKENKCYMPWYYYYGYVLQMAVYQEIARQNYGKKFETHLIAATKEEQPDMDAIHFDNSLLELELKEFSDNIVYYDKIKKGIEPVIKCNCCDYCKANKVITDFREVK